jgi:dienelactone hydrolase
MASARPRRRYHACMNIKPLALTALAFLITAVGMVGAQTASPFSPLDNRSLPEEMMRGAASRAKDLTLPTQTSSFGIFHSPQMALYKPDGDGPFPALVLMHQCGGLRNASGSWQNQSMLLWAKKAVERGYVVLQLDALGPRGVDSVCFGLKGDVSFFRGAKDAFQAAEHLSKLPYVDAKRIGMAGSSWGAMVALTVSSKAWASALASGPRFAAAVSLYPGCPRISPPMGPSYDIAQLDIDRPHLTLMGELDNETPPSDCIPRLEAAKALGAPVEWHLYPATTHCWDCANLNNVSKVDARGNRVTYRYDKAVTSDSETRMFEFLAKNMPPAAK